MPSNKEILEAQKYNRRRLVTAFASGTPEGKEVETRSAFAPLVVGAALVGVMVVIAAILGRLAPRLPANWQDSTLIIVKGTGARYYTVDGVLRPVANITSARLLAPAGQYHTSELSAATIEGIDRGAPIGLTGVPDDVPDARDLRSDLWFSCPLGAATHTWVAELPTGHVRRGVVVVRNQDQLHLIADGVRHAVPADQRTTVLLALGLETSTVHEVPATWLHLFPQGSIVAPLTVEGAGQPAPGMPAALSSAVIGSVVEVSDDGAGRRYVITGAGRAAPLTPVAAKLYPSATPLRASVTDMAGLEVDPAGVAPADWPSQLTEVVPHDSVPCASLGRDASGAPIPVLESMERNALAQALPGSGDPESRLAADQDAASVLGGSGALVRATSAGDLGQVMLVSDLGLIHGLGNDPAESLTRLGYDDAPVVDVPAAWTALIPAGTTLDPEAAWASVGRR